MNEWTYLLECILYINKLKYLTNLTYTVEN